MNSITRLDHAGVKKQVQRAHAGGVVMIFAGKHDMACKQHLRSDLARLSAVTDAVLDFTDVTYIDSTVIVELIRLHSRRTALGRSPMTIVVQQAHLKKLFTLLSLETIFRFTESLEEAIQKDKTAFRLDYTSCGFQGSHSRIGIEFDRGAYRLPASSLVSVSTVELHEALTRRRLGAQPLASVRRRFFPELLERPLAAISAYQKRQPLLQFCYSVKTNPAPDLLSRVSAADLFAEVISPEELRHARKCGFPLSKIVYNGPYPAQYCELPPAYVFADSMEAYIGAAQRFEKTMVGVRMRPTGIASRFGLSFDRLGELVQAVSTCGRREIGISFHVRPEDYGDYTFRTLAESTVDWATEVERRSGARVVVLDVGGGNRPCELDEVISNGDFKWLQTHARSRLPHVRTILAEPGQAIVISCEAVIARILEVRRAKGRVEEVVIDAGYPELPQLRSFQHRIFLMSGENVRAAGNGVGRIVGRTCLEYDIVTRNADLEDCRVNDAIAIADAGAYDASMAFGFAQGSRRA